MSEAYFTVDAQGRFVFRSSILPMLMLMAGRTEKGYALQVFRGGKLLLPMTFKEKPWETTLQQFDRIAQTISRLGSRLGFPEGTSTREIRDAVFQIISRFASEAHQWEENHKEEAQSLPSPEATEKALELLENPDLLCAIYDALKTGGLVGEIKNSLLTYLTMVSAGLPEPLNQRFSGSPGLGKSAIVTHVARLFPPEDLIIRSGATKKTLWYMPEAKEIDQVTRRLDLGGKILVILEESQSREFLDEIKPLLGHDAPSLKYSFVDDKVTKQMVLSGFPAYVGVNVFPIAGEEHARRVLLTAPERGALKYSAVIMNDAKRHSEPWEVTEIDLTVFHEVVRQLKPVKVLVPWLKEVSNFFPASKASDMSHYKQFRILLEAVTFLHQYQRRHVEIKGEEWVEAEPMDFEIVITIAEPALAETLQSLSRDVREFFVLLSAKDNPRTYTYRELIRWYKECFGEPVSRTTLRERYVNPLVDRGYLDCDDTKRTHVFTVIDEKLLADLANFEKALELILSDEMKAKIEHIYLEKSGSKRATLTISGKNYDEPLKLSQFAKLKSLISRSEEEEYAEKQSKFDSAKSASYEVEKEPEKSTFVWRRVRVAEPCEFCGNSAVEYEIRNAECVLRRCEACFNKLRTEFTNAKWTEEVQGRE